MSKRDESWAVTVERNGVQVVTIASNCLAGRDLSPADKLIIRACAEHLRAFIGISPDSSVERMQPYLQHLVICAKRTREASDGYIVPLEPWLAENTDCTCGLAALLQTWKDSNA
jgi:hypothetical protein